MRRGGRSTAQQYAAARKKGRKPGQAPRQAADGGTGLGMPAASQPAPVQEARPAEAAAQQTDRSRKASVRSTEQYRYVLGDVRRIGIISAGIMLGLLVLSFFVR